MKTRRITAIAALAAMLPTLSGCDFLDIVPDNVFQYEDLFTSKESCYSALARIYVTIPTDQRDMSFWTMGDEWVIASPTTDASRTLCQGQSIMRGNQSATSPLLSYWTGSGNWKYAAYDEVHECDLFIDNIDNVPDMTAEEKSNWKAQAQFLKAYYLFLVLIEHGPIVLPAKADPNSPEEDIILPRSKVEDCFQYIISLIDESMPNLKTKSPTNDIGMIDKVTASSMKTRILLYRASPFFNGNSEYYSNFLDSDGEPFFPQQYDASKWKDCLDAADEAIAYCKEAGVELYHYTGRPYEYDRDDWNANYEKMKTLYDLRMRWADSWNSELIWGNTGITVWSLSATASIKKPASYGGPAEAYDGYGSGSASYQVMSRYYTSRGLPLDEDRTVNQNSLFDIVTTPVETDPDYTQWRGYLQPGVSTVQMYLDREPRFYADLDITGGYVRSHQIRINTMMMRGTDGGYIDGVSSTQYNSTGIGIQKCIHPESYGFTGTAHYLFAPYPLMRLSDVYLMKAEAQNEWEGPSDEVYAYVDSVRFRAGIPGVRESYSNPEWVTDEALNKHLTKEGMREIILAERANEFAFENANRFYDMWRQNRAVSEFSQPVRGWNYNGSSPTSFFSQTIVQARSWTIRDNLWPIDNSELEKNSLLIQNPGW